MDLCMFLVCSTVIELLWRRLLKPVNIWYRLVDNAAKPGVSEQWGPPQLAYVWRPICVDQPSGLPLAATGTQNHSTEDFG